METPVTIERAIEIARQTPIHTSTEQVPLNQAHNRILAEDLQSKVDDPPFDNSAMDGWAVDSKVPPPRELYGQPVVAGHPIIQLEHVHDNSARPIMTGAPIPEGADAIVMKEDGINGKAHTNFIRKKGENFLKGDTLLSAGQLLNPSAISLAATMGYGTVPVRSKPRVVVISTGDELIQPGLELNYEGCRYESNSYGLCALLEKIGCIPIHHSVVEDNYKDLRNTLNSLDCDAILTSGGVSMGEWDYVRKVMEREGDLHFWKVAMRPGGPPLFGTWNGTPLFGLPGNPVSSHLVFTILVAPWLAPETPLAKEVRVRMKDPVKGAPGKVCLRRIHISSEGDELVGTTHTHQGSGNIHSLVAHNGVTYLPPDTGANAGDVVNALWFH